MQQIMDRNSPLRDQISEIDDELDKNLILIERNSPLRDQISEISDELDKTLTLTSSSSSSSSLGDEEDEDEDEDDFEFSFEGGYPESPVSAEDIFENGQIRPLHPFSGEHSGDSEEAATTSYNPPVRKVFVVSSTPENGDVAEGPYCGWSEKCPGRTPAPAPEMRRKSNSTGLSKFWRVKDLLARSHSDGKDAFVYLTAKSDEKAPETASFSEDKKKKKKMNNLKIKVGRGETAPFGGKNKGKKSAYEELYGKEKNKGGKSYLPYKQDLVGFFTNVNGMTRNVHPY